jgi:hypothetical protein
MVSCSVIRLNLSEQQNPVVLFRDSRRGLRRGLRRDTEAAQEIAVHVARGRGRRRVRCADDQAPYKEAMPLAVARTDLQDKSGSEFDPACVEAFLSRWDEVVAIATAQTGAPSHTAPAVTAPG